MMKNGQTIAAKKLAWKKPEVKSVTPVRETRGGLLSTTFENAPVYTTS